MSFLDHLEELRWHLIRSVLAIVILASIAFLAKDFIFNVLIFGPKQADFPTYKILCSISNDNFNLLVKCLLAFFLVSSQNLLLNLVLSL